MEVVILFKTSRGTFKTIDEAMLKKNRAKVENDFRGGQGPDGRETPTVIQALEAGGEYLFLNPITVQ